MKNKTVVITGASGKIGGALLKYFSDQNYNVIGTYNENKINILKSNIYIRKVDQSKEVQINNLLKFIKNKKKFNVIGVVNCSVLRPMKKGSKDSFKNWSRSININANSTYLINKKFCEYFAKRKFGRVINIGSIYSVVGPDFNLYKNENFELEPDYMYNKFGMLGLTKYFASKYGKNNVTVNMISPGGVRAKQSKGFNFKYSKKTFLNRMANSNEISGIIEFILSFKSSYLTGQNIIVDGGYTSN